MRTTEKNAGRHKPGSDRETRFVLRGILLVLLGGGGIAFMLFREMKTGMSMGSDLPFHLARMDSLAISLKSGIFPAKLRPVLCNTYGYGVGFFYSDALLYFPAGLICAGVGLLTAVKVYLVVLLLLCFFLTIRGVYALTRDFCASVLSGVFSLLSLELWGELNYGFTFGTVCASVFLPVTFCAFIKIMKGAAGRKSEAAFILGMSLILWSHHTTLLLTVAMMLLLFLLSIREIIRFPERFWMLLRDAVFAVLLTIEYWLPAAEQALKQTFVATGRTYLPVSKNTMTLFQTLNSAGSLVIFLLVFGTTVWVYGMIWRKKNQEELFLALTGMWFGLILMPFSWIWKTFHQQLNFIQSPGRLMTVVSALASIALGIVFADVTREYDRRWKGKKKYLFYLISYVMLISISVRQDMKLTLPFTIEDRYYDNGRLSFEINGLGSGSEWLPVETAAEELTEPDTALSSDRKSGYPGTKKDFGKSFEVYLPAGEEYSTMPYLYYYGYRAYLLNDADGTKRELKVDKSPYNGQVRVYLPQESNGNQFLHVVVAYRKTWAQIMSYLISAFTAIGLLFFYFRKNK